MNATAVAMQTLEKPGYQVLDSEELIKVIRQVEQTYVGMMMADDREGMAEMERWLERLNLALAGII
jgi:hypothetical protein